MNQAEVRRERQRQYRKIKLQEDLKIAKLPNNEPYRSYVWMGDSVSPFFTNTSYNLNDVYGTQFFKHGDSFINIENRSDIDFICTGYHDYKECRDIYREQIRFADAFFDKKKPKRRKRGDLGQHKPKFLSKKIIKNQKELTGRKKSEKLFKAGYYPTEMHNMLSISMTKLKCWYTQYKKYGSCVEIPKKGRPSLIQNCDVDFVKAYVDIYDGHFDTYTNIGKELRLATHNNATKTK